MKRKRRDRNHSQIKKAFIHLGAHVIDTANLDKAFDLLVFFRGSIYPVEVKDGEQPPSKQKLTKGEQEAKEQIELSGCKYHIITSVDEAIDLLTKDREL